MENIFFRELINDVISNDVHDKDEVIRLASKLIRRYRLKQYPKLSKIKIYANEKELDKLNFLNIKPGRSISGVMPVAIMTKPMKCLHGTCTFCPGGPASFFGDVPQSYTGNEPASMRAIRNKFDAYLQVFNRLEHYVLLNQIPEKVELIIMGGTFPAYSKEYQDLFVRDALKAMNDFSTLFFKKDKLNFNYFKEFFELESNFKSKERTENIHRKLLGLKGNSTLEKEQKRNEKIKVRCCVLNVETKPDFCKEEHINQMLKLGVTRVELGVQTLNNEILKITNRGHTVEDSIKAIQIAKDSFLKVCFHMMLGLPGSSKEEDINNFKQLFENEDYKPDALKIYPCIIMPGTKLYEDYKKGFLKPITTQQAVEIILEGKKYIPNYTRIMRINRDIPTKVTIDGVNITNLRQYVHELMKKRGLKCNCMRCREPRNREISWENVKLNRLNYESSNGQEIFLSYDDMKNDILLGFLRLRIPYKPFRKEITESSAGIRELHIYGTAVPIGKRIDEYVQHHGYGGMLLQEAEKISREEFDIKKMLIISGVGVREYFRIKFNYKKEGTYMVKSIY